MTDNRSIRRLAEYMDVQRLRLIDRAKSGDPASLQSILLSVADFLSGDSEAQAADLNFVATALRSFAEDNALWDSAAKEFKALDRSEVPFEAQIVRLGPRISEPTQKKIGRSFCRAFHLAKRPGKLKAGELPKHLLTCPNEVYKIERLRWIGVSRAKSVTIVNSAYPALSKRSLDTWIRFMQINAPNHRDYRFIRNRLYLAARVLPKTSEGMTIEEASFEVAERVACRLFPAHVAQLEWWALQVVEDPGDRSSAQVDLARGILVAKDTGEDRPEISDELYAEMKAELHSAPRETFIRETSIQLIAEAVRKAHRFAERWREHDPRWNLTWERLQRRYQERSS